MAHWYGDAGNRLNIWIRGVLYFLLIYGWYRGLELVPIGDAEAVSFIAPIFIVLIARFALKEELSVTFPFTFFLTISGIVFVCQPQIIFGSMGTDTRDISIVGVCFLFLMALSWAISSILVRTAQSAHWLQIQIVANVQGTLIWCPLIIFLNGFVFDNDWLDKGEWTAFSDNGRTIGLIAVCALCGFIGLSLNVIGYQKGDATKVAMMEYFDLIFAYVFQWLLFGEKPNEWEVIGLLCLLGTCGVHLVEEILKYMHHKENNSV